jgi:hypothetical protein
LRKETCPSAGKPIVGKKALDIFLKIRDLGLFLRLAELEAPEKGGNNGGYNEKALEEIFHLILPRTAIVFSLIKAILSTLFTVYIEIVRFRTGSCFLRRRPVYFEGVEK